MHQKVPPSSRKIVTVGTSSSAPKCPYWDMAFLEIIEWGHRLGAIIDIRGWVIIPGRLSCDLWNRAIIISPILFVNRVLMACNNVPLLPDLFHCAAIMTITCCVWVIIALQWTRFKQYSRLIYGQQPIGMLHLITLNDNEYSLIYKNRDF